MRRPPHAASTRLSAPGALRLLLEARAPWEYAATLAAAPVLARSPAGDGHPVVVFPGLGASDLSTAPMRRFLRGRGYTPYAWRRGMNLGPRKGVLEHCRALVQQAHERHRERVSLVGWSLGGLYARELAKQMPELVRCVVTLGTPFAGHPRANNAWRFYELVSGQRVQDAALIDQIRQPPACPTTSVYSRSDGIVAWQCSINDPAPHTENVEVRASHVGMGLNPLALYVLADRLAQDPRCWRRFDSAAAGRSRLARWLFRPSPAAAMAAP